MKVLLVNTSGQAGGAAIAASRLAKALNHSGVQAKMLVADLGGSNNPDVVAPKSRWRYKWSFLTERLNIFVRQRFSKKHLFDIDPALTGINLTSTTEFREADIIHLHWVNQGFLSLKGIKRILESGKPVVWTMHDMWTFTGLCHNAYFCDSYTSECNNCPMLVSRGTKDLSNVTWRHKKTLWSHFPNLTFVACSQWLEQTAAASPLLSNHPVQSIANPIDCHVYAPHDKTTMRRELGLPADGKKLILFCAYNVLAPIKGLTFLKQALQQLIERRPELKDQLGLVLVGKGSETVGSSFPVEVYPMGLVSDESIKVKLYCAADVLTTTSLQENLPNTIVEAKASGLPVIGTKVGGIPQMINDGIDGRLVTPGAPTELADALEWTLCEANLGKMAEQCRLDALANYSEEIVAENYINCYKKLLSKSVATHNEK